LTIAFIDATEVGIGQPGNAAAPAGDKGKPLREWNTSSPWNEIEDSALLAEAATGSSGIAAAAVRFTLKPSRIQLLLGTEAGAVRFQEFLSEENHALMEISSENIELPSHAGEVRSVAFGNGFVVSAADDGARLATFVEGKQVFYALSTEPTVGVAVSSNSQRVVTAAADGRIRVFDPATRELICTGGTTDVNALIGGRSYHPVAFLTDHLVAVGGSEAGESRQVHGSVTLRSAEDCAPHGKAWATAGRVVTALLVATSERRIISGTDTGIVQIWRVPPAYFSAK
jgi:hypothetical protein